jgi:Ca2+-binding EF-hand superfamily protein
LININSLATIKNTGKGDVTFDNFVQACVTMKTLTDSFRQFDNDQDGWIQINYEQVTKKKKKKKKKKLFN